MDISLAGYAATGCPRTTFLQLPISLVHKLCTKCRSIGVPSHVPPSPPPLTLNHSQTALSNSFALATMGGFKTILRPPPPGTPPPGSLSSPTLSQLCSPALLPIQSALSTTFGHHMLVAKSDRAVSRYAGMLANPKPHKHFCHLPNLPNCQAGAQFAL